MWAAPVSGFSDEVAAFARVYDLTAAHAFELALRLLGEVALAEKATQAAHLDLWNHPHGRSWQENPRVVLDVLSRVQAQATALLTPMAPPADADGDL